MRIDTWSPMSAIKTCMVWYGLQCSVKKISKRFQLQKIQLVQHAPIMKLQDVSEIYKKLQFRTRMISDFHSGISQSGKRQNLNIYREGGIRKVSKREPHPWLVSKTRAVCRAVLTSPSTLTLSSNECRHPLEYNQPVELIQCSNIEH